MDTQSGDQTEHQKLTFHSVLWDLNEAGHFMASFLVDSEGLPVASESSAYDPDAASAMTAMVKKVVEQAQFQLHLSDAVEVNIRADDKTHLVCRYFSLGDETLILVVVVPPGKPYRLVTTRAIKAIKNIWSD